MLHIELTPLATYINISLVQYTALDRSSIPLHRVGRLSYITAALLAAL